MAVCVLLRGATAFSVTGEPIETCGESIGQHVAITATRYQELLDLSTGTEEGTPLEEALLVLDPVEIASVFGSTFMLVFSLAALAWKIRVAKNVIKLA